MVMADPSDLGHGKKMMAQTDRQTHTKTDGHGDSMTNSTQKGRVGENKNIVNHNLL